MKEFVEYIIKNIVDLPEKVDIRCLNGERGVIVEVRVESGDVGKVIGRKGNTIKALRTVLAAIGARIVHPVRIEIIEESQS